MNEDRRRKSLQEYAQDLRDHLGRLERCLDKIENSVDRSERRLINIELKANMILRPDRGIDTTDFILAFPGHQHQAFGHLTFSQFGEDLILSNLFAMIGTKAPSYLDVGAYHPVNLSNTALLYSRGSRGINVEPNPDLFPAFEANRSEDVNLNIGVGAVPGHMDFHRIDETSGRSSFDLSNVNSALNANPAHRISDTLKIRVETLNMIVDRYWAGRFPDLLSVDAEGWDYDILAATDLSRSKPAIICVEAISGDNIDATPRLVPLLCSRGYELYVRTVANLIFLSEDSLKRIREFRL
ncbi:FkbM family methyltransferase [Reyranella massiliensis]|uniref:FkbM family methyltransferase n=1 Tax=Reyranella massiliensis TaxID=445220 RepID=UPI001C07C083|nr:FkbM family methyltransferase [Reyranella massiliensis]